MGSFCCSCITLHYIIYLNILYFYFFSLILVCFSADCFQVAVEALLFGLPQPRSYSYRVGFTLAVAPVPYVSVWRPRCRICFSFGNTYIIVVLVWTPPPPRPCFGSKFSAWPPPPNSSLFFMYCMNVERSANECQRSATVSERDPCWVL